MIKYIVRIKKFKQGFPAIGKRHSKLTLNSPKSLSDNTEIQRCNLGLLLPSPD